MRSRPQDETPQLNHHFDEVYDELRAAAARYMHSERAGHTLRATALVNEAYLRLAKHRGEWESREHFFAAAASTMRRILVDHARRRDAARRGDGARRVTLSAGSGPATPALDLDVVDLHQALLAFGVEDERSARVVELRFFGGLTIEEVARVLEVSPASVKRDWAYAKAWLLRRMEFAGGRGHGGH